MLPKNKVTKSPKGPTSSASVLVQKLSAGDPKEKIGATMYKLWASNIPKFHPEVKFIGAFTLAQKAMITRLATGWGAPAEKTLAHVIEHWVSFGKYLREVVGVKTVPQVPVLEFLVKHSSMAMNFFLKQSSLQTTAKPEVKTLGSTVVSGRISIKKVALTVCPAPSSNHPLAPVKPAPVAPAVEEAVSLAEILAFDPSESEI